MPTQTINLTNQDSSLIEALVKSGRYTSADQVLKVGLRLIEAKELRDKPTDEATATTADDLSALIVEARAARDQKAPLQPGEILAWRGEGRA